MRLSAVQLVGQLHLLRQIHRPNLDHPVYQRPILVVEVPFAEGVRESSEGGELLRHGTGLSNLIVGYNAPREGAYELFEPAPATIITGVKSK